MMEVGKSLILSESCHRILEKLLESLEEDLTSLLEQDLKYSRHLEEEEVELSRLELHFLLLLQALSSRKTTMSARLLQEGNNWSALPNVTSAIGGRLSAQTKHTLDFAEGAAEFAHRVQLSGLIKVPGIVLKNLDSLAEKRRRRRRRLSSKSEDKVKMEVDYKSGEVRRQQDTCVDVVKEGEASKRDQAVQTTDVQYAVVSKIYLPRVRKPVNGKCSKVVRSRAVEEASRALYVALERNDIKRVLVALKAGADVGWRWYGCTPLLFASASGYNEVMEVLLEYGANVEEADPSGDRPVHYAVRWARSSTVQRLVSAGANLTAPGQAGRTPLQIAAIEGDPGILDILLKAGVPIETPNVNGNRALHLAAMCGRDEAVTLLATAGADLYAKGEFGKTPLQLARACGQHTTAELLRSLMEPK